MLQIARTAHTYLLAVEIGADYLLADVHETAYCSYVKPVASEVLIASYGEPVAFDGGQNLVWRFA